MALAFVTSTPSTPSFSLVELIPPIFHPNASLDFKSSTSDNEMLMTKVEMLQI